MIPIRLAIVVSHPIQYFAPLYRALAGHPRIDLRVFFLSRHGLAAGMDNKMGVPVAWATNLTGGYAHTFLAPPGTRRNVEGLRNSDARTLGRHLKRFNPQAVLVHGYAHWVCLRAIAWSWLRRVPLLMLSDGSIDAGSGRVRMALKRLILPKLLSRIAAFLCISERGERFLGGWGVERERRHRLPLVLSGEFTRSDEASRKALRREWGVGEDDLVVLAVGKIYAEKRVGDLVSALAGVHARLGRRIVCVVAGDGIFRAAVAARAREIGVAAIFPGFVNLDRLPAFYRAADIFVHAAEREQYGMVVLEAACAGLPLVVSDKVGALGPSDAAQPGRNAIAFPAGDVERLREALQCLVDDPARRARMSEASRAIAARHTPEYAAQAVCRALEAALAR